MEHWFAVADLQNRCKATYVTRDLYIDYSVVELQKKNSIKRILWISWLQKAVEKKR